MPQERMKQGKQTLGIYVHIPFCIKKCDYCDFLSMPADEAVKKDYIEQLNRELRYRAPLAKEYEVDSIFIGGGTPSCIDAHDIAQLMQTISDYYLLKKTSSDTSGKEHLRLHHNSSDVSRNDVEVTIECNPGTLEEEKLQIYKSAGINRISLGLQSACNEELRLLGRIHTWEQFESSVQLVKDLFDNWNVDVMSALPGQTMQSYRNTLQSVLALHPPHISAYSLIIEEGTPFYARYEEDDERRQQGRQPHFLPSEDEERAMYELTGRMLKEHGYHRYEISNYAKDGYESRHNNRYWLRKAYLGVGLGASSFMGQCRWNNVSGMSSYMALDEKTAFAREQVQQLSIKEQIEETMFLGLRRMQGIDKERFRQQFAESVEDVYGDVLQELELHDLIRNSGKYIQLTQFGIDVSNYVLAQFL